jgi:putative methyltransferase (TIGR04325 family)
MTYEGPIWEGVYRSFSEVPAEEPGFDGETWISNSLKRIAALREEAERNVLLPPASNYREGLLPLLAALGYNENGSVRILDFGGGLGFTYYQTICGLPRTEGVEYHVVEREAVCRAGKEFFGANHSNLQFLTELPQTWERFDIVHSGSAIHYVEDWKQLLSRLCVLSRKYLLLVDVPAGNIPTFAAAQHYYGSKIPVWFFNIEELLSAVGSFGHELIFKSVYESVIRGVKQSLPMQNFEEQYRLKQACNLLFERLGDE